LIWETADFQIKKIFFVTSVWGPGGRAPRKLYEMARMPYKNMNFQQRGIYNP
jgi:hypothetical protein